MSLKEQYMIKTGRRIRGIMLLFSIFIFFFSISSSFAKYEQKLEASVKVDVANWNIKINNQSVTNNNVNILLNQIILIPTTNKIEGNPQKLKPGQEGYFDIIINPIGTEVSFEYKLKIDVINLPINFVIEYYAISNVLTDLPTTGTTPIPTNKIISNTVLLKNKIALDETNIQFVRCFWKWSGEEKDNLNYEVKVHVDLKQIV